MSDPKAVSDAIESAGKMTQDADAAMPEASVQQFIMDDIDDAGAEKGREHTWQAFLDAPKIDTASAAGIEQPLVDQPQAQPWAADAQHMEGPPAPPMAQILGDAGGEAREPFQQPGDGKKKRQSTSGPNWGDFLGTLGKGLGVIGRATGSKQMSGLGSILQSVPQFMSADGMGGQGGGEDDGSTGHLDTITSVLGAMGGGSQGSQASSTEGADAGDDLQKALEKLTDAVTLLIEKMGGQASSGVSGTQMPAGGSFGMSGDGGGIDLKQIVQIIELITTMGRIAALAAA